MPSPRRNAIKRSAHARHPFANVVLRIDIRVVGSIQAQQQYEINGRTKAANTNKANGLIHRRSESLAKQEQGCLPRISLPITSKNIEGRASVKCAAHAAWSIHAVWGHMVRYWLKHAYPTILSNVTVDTGTGRSRKLRDGLMRLEIRWNTCLRQNCR